MKPNKNWTLHQDSSPNFADFGQNKSEGKPRFNFDNKKLLEPSKIRTFCIELHNAINSTNSNIFRQIQGYKIENTINFS